MSRIIRGRSSYARAKKKTQQWQKQRAAEKARIAEMLKDYPFFDRKFLRANER